MLLYSKGRCLCFLYIHFPFVLKGWKIARGLNFTPNFFLDYAHHFSQVKRDYSFIYHFYYGSIVTKSLFIKRPFKFIIGWSWKEGTQIFLSINLKIVEYLQFTYHKNLANWLTFDLLKFPRWLCTHFIFVMYT